VFINNKKAVTFVELLISVAIGVMIIVLMTTVFGQNIMNMRMGQKISDLEYGKHLIIKELYIELINLNSPVTFSEERHELSTQSMNFIILSERNESNTFEKLSFDSYTLKDLAKNNKVSYYIESGNFIKEINGRKRKLLSNIEELNFSYFNRMIYCKGKFVAPKTKEYNKIDIPFEFGLYIGGDRVGVKYE